MVISAMRKKKSSAVKHGVRKLLSGKALELQSQRSRKSRPGNDTGLGYPREAEQGSTALQSTQGEPRWPQHPARGRVVSEQTTVGEGSHSAFQR